MPGRGFVTVREIVEGTELASAVTVLAGTAQEPAVVARQ
jgi:hypothetical protein